MPDEPRAPANIEPPSARPIQILFVDDDRAVLRALADICEKDGGFVAAIADGADTAWIEMEKQRPDIVVSDQRMPTTTGTELLSQLRTKYPNVVRVLMTAEPHAEVSRRALADGGVHAIIEKPWTLRALLATLRSASAQARAHRIAAAADVQAAVRAFKRG